LSHFFRENAREVRTLEDLDRAVRTIATHFKAEKVIIIGSQSVLLEWPDAPILMRTSGEIDLYPGNAREWEALKNTEASEEIFALFGEGSTFHETHGFYIDGVDETTAKLPRGWYDRAIVRDVENAGVLVVAVAPSPHDLAVSKMHRLEEKDIAYIEARHAIRPFDIDQLRQYFLESAPDGKIYSRGTAFLETLARS
jgi:hypothetical protein